MKRSIGTLTMKGEHVKMALAPAEPPEVTGCAAEAASATAVRTVGYVKGYFETTLAAHDEP